MSKEMKRPVININRVYEDKRSVMEAFVTVLVHEMERRASIRTFESVKEPEYTVFETEVKKNGTTN